MKRWAVALIAAILSCIPVLLMRATTADILNDSDTHVLIWTLRRRNAPWSWFTGDWPLANHFYRPVSTLAFEMDNRLYRDNAIGYAWTNALLVAACVLLLFWFLREFTDNPIVSGAATVLFALQLTGHEGWAVNLLEYLALATVVIGIIRHRLKLRYWLPAALVLAYCQVEVGTGWAVGDRTIDWLPGRTATVMTVFALTAMAAYARYERLGAERMPSPPPTPLDPPATRSAENREKAGSSNIVWGILSVVGVLLALGSYEQAVMLPAVLLAVAVTMRLNRYRVRWGWQAAFWLCLVGYLLLRKAVIPPGASSYQLQQFRHGPGVRLSLFGYILPVANDVEGFLVDMESGLNSFFMAAPWEFLLLVAMTVAAYWQARRRWIFILAGYGMSIIAFLPMAWVKQFAHYNFWPLALRSVMTVTLVWVALDQMVSAWSPPTRQAPPRPDPAPGSLPHP